MMSGKRNQVAKELGKFVEAFWMELPKAAAKEVLGGATDEINKAGWKAYDAWVSLANETTNQLYANPVLGAFTGSTTENVLRLQQIGNAAASAFFANLWPSVGLPTAQEVAALRAEITSLLSDLNEEVKTEKRHASALYNGTNEDGLKLIRHARVRRREQKDGQDAAA